MTRLMAFDGAERALLREGVRHLLDAEPRGRRWHQRQRRVQLAGLLNKLAEVDTPGEDQNHDSQDAA